MRRIFVVLSLGAVACDLGAADPNDGGQFGEEAGARCEAVGATPLGADEVSALGFAPQALLDLAVGTHADTLAWAQLGTTTGVTLTVSHDGGAMELVDYEVVSEGGSGGMEPAIEPALFCADQVEIEVAVSLTTDDGAFAESWTVRLAAAEAARASFSRELDAVSGTFDPWDHAPAGNTYDTMRAWVDVAFDAAGASGVISGQGEGVEGGDRMDPDSVAYAESVDIGSWGAPRE